MNLGKKEVIDQIPSEPFKKIQYSIREETKMKKQSFVKFNVLSIVVTLFLVAMTICPGEAQQKNWPKGITIAGSNLGSGHYIYCGAWGTILSNKLGLSAQVEVTQGPAINVQLCNSKQTDFVPVTMAVVAEGYRGIGWAKDKKYDDVRNMLPMYPSYWQWWVMAKSNVKSIHDLNGQDIALSGAGSTPDIYGRRMLELFNIKPRRIISGGFGDANNMLKDGMIVGSAAFAGVPHPAAVEMQATHEMRILGLSKADAEKMVAKYPGLSIDVIPAGVYKGHDTPIETLSVWTAIVTHKDQPEDFVYAILKNTFENKETLIAAFKEAKHTIPENITKTYNALPLHVGAVKFYKEKGIPIPDSELPPEYKK